MDRIFALFAAAALLAGCNANLGFQVGNMGRSATVPTVGPGSSFSSSGVSIRFGDVPPAGAFIGAAGIGMLYGSDPQAGTQRTPPMDESRRINEQDCRNPVQNSGNLHCR